MAPPGQGERQSGGMGTSSGRLSAGASLRAGAEHNWALPLRTADLQVLPHAPPD